MLLTCLLVGLLLLPEYDTGGANGRETELHENYYDNATSARLFRFRDFVPRSAYYNDSQSTRRSDSARRARGFQFHVDNDDIYVDLEFTIPFVEIPVARGMTFARTSLRNLVNLNTASLLLSGVIVALGSIVFVAFKALNTPTIFTYDYHGKKQTRLDETLFNSNFPNAMHMHDLVSSLEAKLQRHNIDTTACLQRSICNYVRGFALDMRDGSASGWHKIVNGILDLEQLRLFMSGSALEQAIAAGRTEGDNCDVLPGNCHWLTPVKRLFATFNHYLA